MPFPNFMIPGAGKSGTSFLAKVLGQHQDIFIPDKKEPAYFSTYSGRGRYAEGVRQYLKYFHGYSGERYIGEASTVYMYDPDSPKLIRENLGEIPLIFVLRNPVDRIYSNYWQDIKGGYKLPPFHEMVAQRHPMLCERVEISRYGKHLSRYLEYFDRSDITLIFFDELINNPESIIYSILDRLELPNFDTQVDFFKNENTSSVPRVRIISRALRSQAVMTPLRRIASPAASRWMQAVARSVRKWAEMEYSYPPMNRESRLILTSELLPDINIVEQIAGRDLTAWKHAE